MSFGVLLGWCPPANSHARSTLHCEGESVPQGPVHDHDASPATNTYSMEGFSNFLFHGGRGSRRTDDNMMMLQSDLVLNLESLYLYFC